MVPTVLGFLKAQNFLISETMLRLQKGLVTGNDPLWTKTKNGIPDFFIFFAVKNKNVILNIYVHCHRSHPTFWDMSGKSWDVGFFWQKWLVLCSFSSFGGQKSIFFCQKTAVKFHKIQVLQKNLRNLMSRPKPKNHIISKPTFF